MIVCRNLHKTYNTGAVSFEALKGVFMDVQQGEFISIMGPSGSGKSTLMNILGCLDTPTRGSYYLDGRDVSGLSFDQLAEIRGNKIGFVFQSFNLLPYLTAAENVELPLLYNGSSPRLRHDKVESLLSMVGLGEWKDHRPTELSGGQQQRVAIARALANDPPVILADEPTGNLDSRSGLEIMELFTSLWQQGRTIIMVTHDEKIARYSRRIVTILDGIVESDREFQDEPDVAVSSREESGGAAGNL